MSAAYDDVAPFDQTGDGGAAPPATNRLSAVT